ncbi:CPBP family intramembrane glutamic endopeptidase [Priestia filamentosa]|uniref:CPBP family intramembrane glutamic endopeptidase n=1 Tax=Priestia filamentosa TaxID=1402861 RepID=UPI0039828CED
MDTTKQKSQSTGRDFKPKDAVIAFSSFTLMCTGIILLLIIYSVLTVKDFLTFDQPYHMLMNVGVASVILLVFGIILTYCIPSRYIDETNKGYQNYSLLSITSFLAIGALFEELLFRGIIQNVFFVFLDHKWMAIGITTLLFLSIHIQYFKKPIMFLNITLPSVVFGWIYFETENILVPFLVHFILNIGMTLLFKYNLINLRK